MQEPLAIRPPPKNDVVHRLQHFGRPARARYEAAYSTHGVITWTARGMRLLEASLSRANRCESYAGVDLSRVHSRALQMERASPPTAPLPPIGLRRSTNKARKYQKMRS